MINVINAVDALLSTTFLFDLHIMIWGPIRPIFPINPIILSDPIFCPIFRLIFLFYLYFNRKLENFQKFVNSIPYKFYFQVKYIQKIVKILNIVYIMVGTVANKYFLILFEFYCGILIDD
jgi:hypothetical protein